MGSNEQELAQDQPVDQAVGLPDYMSPDGADIENQGCPEPSKPDAEAKGLIRGQPLWVWAVGVAAAIVVVVILGVLAVKKPWAESGEPVVMSKSQGVNRVNRDADIVDDIKNGAQNAGQKIQEGATNLANAIDKKEYLFEVPYFFGGCNTVDCVKEKCSRDNSPCAHPDCSKTAKDHCRTCGKDWINWRVTHGWAIVILLGIIALFVVIGLLCCLCKCCCCC